MDERQKRLQLMAYWLFTTVAIVFAAVAAYIAIWARPIGATWGMIVWKAFWPITVLVTLAAGLIYAGYYFLVYKKEE